MTESSPTHVFYGSANAEQVKIPKKESKIVASVRKGVDSWLERVGPKSVEKHFIKAHENVLATLNSEQRKEVFAKEADKWRKQGKILGIAATAIDTSLVALGFGLTYFGLRNPQKGADIYLSIIKNALHAQHKSNPIINIPAFLQSYQWKLYGSLPLTGTFNPENASFTDLIDSLKFKDDYVNSMGMGLATTTGILSGILALSSGPGHWLAHLAAGGKEQFGKMKARTNNYVDSGKAAEHAKAVGKTLGDAAKSTARYVAEHPDEIRKTVETVSRVKRQNAESAQKVAEAKQKAADIALEKEYQDWIAHHPDKAYYEESGEPYPSKAEYVAKKQEEAAKKKANKEAEERGMAKH